MHSDGHVINLRCMVSKGDFSSDNSDVKNEGVRG